METEELVELIRLVGCEVLVKRRETPSRREKAKKFRTHSSFSTDSMNHIRQLRNLPKSLEF